MNIYIMPLQIWIAANAMSMFDPCRTYHFSKLIFTESYDCSFAQASFTCYRDGFRQIQAVLWFWIQRHLKNTSVITEKIDQNSVSSKISEAMGRCRPNSWCLILLECDLKCQKSLNCIELSLTKRLNQYGKSKKHWFRYDTLAVGKSVELWKGK